MSRKQNTYDIWSIRGDDSEVDTVAGGEEVLGLSCLLPRKKDGKMVSGMWHPEMELRSGLLNF